MYVLYIFIDFELLSLQIYVVGDQVPFVSWPDRRQCPVLRPEFSTLLQNLSNDIEAEI